MGSEGKRRPSRELAQGGCWHHCLEGSWVVLERGAGPDCTLRRCVHHPARHRISLERSPAGLLAFGVEFGEEHKETKA